MHHSLLSVFPFSQPVHSGSAGSFKEISFLHLWKEWRQSIRWCKFNLMCNYCWYCLLQTSVKQKSNQNFVATDFHPVPSGRSWLWCGGGWGRRCRSSCRFWPLWSWLQHSLCDQALSNKVPHSGRTGTKHVHTKDCGQNKTSLTSGSERIIIATSLLSRVGSTQLWETWRVMTGDGISMTLWRDPIGLETRMPSITWLSRHLLRLSRWGATSPLDVDFTISCPHL